MKVRPGAVLAGLLSGGLLFWLFEVWWAFSIGFLVVFLMGQKSEV